jgi:hypothetical protein
MTAILAFLTGNLWRTACLALALALAWTSFRADHWHSAFKAEKASHAATIANYRQAQAEAEAKALKAKADTEAHYRDIAERTDHEATKAIADARTAAQRYIDSHRVRDQAPIRQAGGPTASADNRDPGVPQVVSDDRLVVIGDDDVRRCSDATAYAVAAHDWALSLARPSR